MSILIDDFANADTLRPFVDGRLRAYEDKAVALLRKHFQPAAGIADDTDLRRFVSLCHDRAKARGIVSEKELLHYLTIAFRWGAGFEEDPQYRPYLRRAMWLVEEDRAVTLSDTALLREEAAHWDAVIADDLASPAHIRDGLFNLYRRGVPDPGYAHVLRLLQRVYPQRFQTVPEADWIAFCDDVNARISDIPLEVVDIYCCIVLAVYFGADFINDPRFPWMRATLASGTRNLEERRIAFGEAVLGYYQRLTGAQA
ncbi:hypothetical protein [Paracoccus sp. S1E-3]|uniref:hypothetical protein n=1 Tax=Paracoccus sp. S1E-3 TaxID=2756130 RepID=UPI0015EF052C|nr:hypothetical protein [Paracoccus sp. S1E-3]MBA4491710.1 hypothetical protein [Paracoccus sp. S1E-3]